MAAGKDFSRKAGLLVNKKLYDVDTLWMPKELCQESESIYTNAQLSIHPKPAATPPSSLLSPFVRKRYPASSLW